MLVVGKNQQIDLNVPRIAFLAQIRCTISQHPMVNFEKFFGNRLYRHLQKLQNIKTPKPQSPKPHTDMDAE